MAKIQKYNQIKTVAQFLKEKKAQNKTKQQQAAELRFANYIKNTAKSMITPIPKYELNTITSDKFQTVNSIPTPTDSIWAPWNKMFRKGK